MASGLSPMDDLVNETDVWREKRVLITGHTGFKGGWLTHLLANAGAWVAGISLPPEPLPTFYSVASVRDALDAEWFLDIRNMDSLRESMEAARPEVVFHLAAEPLVFNSYEQPLKTLETNFMGTAHVLECLREIPTARAAVIVTTDKVYAPTEPARPRHETDPLGGSDLYSASKAASELLVSAYRSSFLNQSGVSVATARAGNVLGGGDWTSSRLVPHALEQIWERRPIELRQPSSRRPWQHVLDPLAGYMLLAENLLEHKKEFSGAFNFGPMNQEHLTAAEVVERLGRLLGQDISIQTTESPHEELDELLLASGKAEDELGWRSTWDIDRALGATAEWYSAWRGNSNMRDVSIRQIVEFTRARTHR